MTHADPARAAEVYYDGACPVCRREIAVLQRALGDPAIAWTNVAERAPKGMDQAELLARFHVRRVDGRLVSGAAAFLALYAGSRRLRPVVRLLERRPFIWGLEAAYRGFLSIRRLWR
ncbi:MAG: DCC1-like thiol-disulfide oxidoreductase family protein [Pseudomonadota bacterium]